MRRLFIPVVAAFVAIAGSWAHALCSDKGQMYAKTTIAEEFADSKCVVRAKVLAAADHWSDEDESWTIYQVQVLTAFKGNPRSRMQMFTDREPKTP